MAVPIEGFTVVVKKERIAPLLDRGEIEPPNRRSLADDDLWMCAFMAEADASKLVQALEALELNGSTGPDSDVVVVSEFEQTITPYCEWLELTTWEKAVIAWKVGSQPESVTAWEGWDPAVGSGLTFYDPAADELEFVRLDENVEVFRNKRTGKELYIGRSAASNEALFQSAFELLSKQWVSPGEPALTGEARQDAASAVEMLQTLATRAPGAWRVFWMLGKGQIALGDLPAAYEAFRRAFEIEQDSDAVFRELGGVCLELGRFEEAVQVTQKAVAFDPANAGLLSNLALAYLLAGRLPEAQKTIGVALAKDGADRINVTVNRLIDEVVSGKRPQPQSMRELQG